MSQPDPDLFEIFAAEQAEHVQRMRSVIEALNESPPETALEELMRLAHTLKGASRAAGFEPTEILTHSLEGAFASLRGGQVPFTQSVRSLFLRVLDRIEDILAAVLANRRVPESEDLLREITKISGTLPQGTPAILESKPKVSSEPDSGPATTFSAEFVRINAAYLDELMSASSELVASTDVAASETGVLEQVSRVESAAREWSRLRQGAAPYLRSRHHDPELTPVRECIQGAERFLQFLLAEVRNTAASRQRREWELRGLGVRLDETAFRVRMVKADTVFGGFGPMLRNLAQEHRKQIEFRAEGLELPADRLVLQSLKDPIMHLLRNALSHGIEPEAERAAAGKPPCGTIRLSMQTHGDRLHVMVEDDGRGLDRRALKDQAVRQFIISEGVSVLSDEGLADLIFRPGFSTSTELTKLSGRGIGLSVVKHEVTRLHGEIRVRSELGKGTAITLTVPLSISSQQVLLVEAGGYMFGIPTSFSRRLLQIRKQDIRMLDGKPAIAIDGLPITLVRLTDLLNLPETAEREDDETLDCVVLAAGGRIAAVVVHRLIDVRDAVIKPTGLPPSSAGWTAGAIPLPDGAVAVILNMTDLLGRFREVSERATTFSTGAASAEKVASKILVVDDSMTTRSLEKSLLETHGYEVQVAVDGVEALEKLRLQTFDVVITDLMMPRMDGFQLLEQIRRDQVLARTPVIIVSSMESRADQERGLALGADAYIVKRKFDQRELLETVRQIL